MMARIFVFLCCLFTLLANPAAAQTELLPAFGEESLKGPTATKGAMIWNHGLNRVAESIPAAPFFADDLREAGWDVFVMKRRWAADNQRDSSIALSNEVDRLKKQGYRRIVLAGQSFGGWLSFIVAGLRDDVHAVIATAPAAHGQVGTDASAQLNADNLFKLAERVKNARVMTFFFERDSFDPGGRAERLAKILDDKNLFYTVVDKPQGLSGHGVGQSSGFARRFGPCIVAFVEAPRAERGFACERVAAGKAPDFPGPENQRIKPPPANAAKGLAPFSGRWYGTFENGQEIMLTVEEMGVDRVIATFAWRVAYRVPNQRSGFQRRRGEWDSTTQLLSFTEPNRPSMTYRLRPDGVMETKVKVRDDRPELPGTLRRIN